MASKYHWYSFLTFILSLGLIAAGAFGLYWWTEKSIYMTTPGIIPGGVAAFDPISVLCLTLFTIASPIGFVLLIHSIMVLLRYLSFNPNKPQQSTGISLVLYVFALLLTIGTFGTLSFFAYMWSEKVLQCAFFLCLDESKWPQPDGLKDSKDAEGFKATIAAPLIMISFALSITFLAMIFREIYRYCTSSTPNRRRKNEEHQSLLTDSLNYSSNDSTVINSLSGNGSSAIKTTSYTPYNTYYQITRNKNGQEIPSVVNTTRPVCFRLTSLIILIFTLFTTFFFFSSYIPNSFRFYWPKIAANLAALHVTNKTMECIQKGAYSCPERMDALFQTIPIELSPRLILKLFPSNIIFYSFVLLAILFPFIARLIPVVDYYLQKKITIKTPTFFFWFYARRKPLLTMTPVYWSLYELLLSFWLTLGSCLFFFYWFQDHNYKTRWPGSDITSFWEKIYRSTGQVAVILLSLLMFPVARTSPILQLMGISWDKGINFHRWAGVGFMLMTVVHMVSSYISFFQEGGWQGVLELLWPFPPIKVLENQDNFTIPLIQWITILSFITIGIIAVYEPIRRAKYDLFLICHHLTYMTLIPATLWHAQAAWEYLIPALSLYLSDRLIRLYRGSQSVDLIQTTAGEFKAPDLDFMLKSSSPFSLHSIDFNLPSTKPITSINAPRDAHMSPNVITSGPGVRLIDYGESGKYIELRIDNSHNNFVFFPGHYVFMNIAEISLFEWHPMTISGHTHSQSHELSFLIKCEGESNSWTHNLYNYIKTTTDKQLPAEPNAILKTPLTISLDGPYGDLIDFNKYDNIVLIAGGAGITPVKAIMNSLWLSFLHDFIANDPNKAKLQQQLISQFEETQRMNKIPLSEQITLRNKRTKEYDAENNSQDKAISLPKHVHLFFAARDAALFECMADTLGHIPTGTNVPFTAELLCSKNGELVPIQTDLDLGDMVLDSPDQDPKIKVYHNLAHHITAQRQEDHELKTMTPLERSVINALGVKSLKEIKDPTRTLFFACGPHRLTQQAKEIAVRYGFHQHEEQFEL